MRTRRGRIRFVWDAIGILLFVVIAFPVYWMVASAFKPDQELNGFTPTWFSMHPTLALVSVIVVTAWQSVGLAMVIFLAGLQSVPNELVEAAEIDGARPWRVFRDVTVPILKPIFLILTSLSIIWDFGVFTQPFLLIDQTRINATNELMGIYLYEEGYVKTDFGRGAAISILMLLIVAVLSIVYVRKMVRTGDEAA